MFVVGPAMVSLIAATGLRVGDLLALRWSALDLDAGTLAVRESVFEGKFQPPKTQRVWRTIPLGPRAAAVLKRHREMVMRREADDLVFANSKGDPSARRSSCSASFSRQPNGSGWVE